jgi:hypothetical protein
LFKLFGSIFIDNEEANKSIAKTEEKAESLGSKLGNGVKTAAKWGAAIVGGATAAGGALLAITNQTAEYADEIDKLSERTGINREELQRWKYAAAQSGADIGKLEVGIKTLSGYMDDAMNGSKKATDAFAALGISVDDLRNKSQEEIFEEVMKSLGDMEQGAQRNAIGADLLGRSYTELLPLLNAGSDGMQELKDRADELGIVMSEEAVKANVTFGDTLQDIKESFGGIVRGLTNSFLPIMQQFADFIVANMPMIQGILSNVFNSVGESVAAILPFLMNLIQNALPPLIDLFTRVATDILPPVIVLFTEILQAVLPPLIDLLTGVATTILPPLIDLLTIIIEDILPPFIDLFNDVISAVLPPLMDLFNRIINVLLPPLIDLFKQIIDAIMPVLIELFDTFTQTVLPPLMELINEIVAVILPPLLDLFNDLAEVVLPLVMTVFEAMLPVIEPIMNAISAVIKTVLALIKGDWEGVWSGIKEFFGSALDYIVALVQGWAKIFGSIFEGIKKVVLGVWNGIVDGIKGAINWVINGINTFIRGLNKIKIPDWVPLVGGKGIDIKEIPLLAAGGEITQRGHVIVGEAGPELLELPQGAKVKPLDTRSPQEIRHTGTIRVEGVNDQGQLSGVVDIVIERLLQEVRA